MREGDRQSEALARRKERVQSGLLSRRGERVVAAAVVRLADEEPALALLGEKPDDLKAADEMVEWLLA